MRQSNGNIPIKKSHAPLFSGARLFVVCELVEIANTYPLVIIKICESIASHNVSLVMFDTVSSFRISD